MATKSMNFKLDEELKEQFEAVAKGIGINSSALLNILIKRTVMEQGVPFDVTAKPNLDRAQEYQALESRLLEAEKRRLSDEAHYQSSEEVRQLVAEQKAAYKVGDVHA